MIQDTRKRLKELEKLVAALEKRMEVIEKSASGPAAAPKKTPVRKASRKK